MLAIRLQRTGRKGYPTYRFIVQEAHRQPTSGRVVANLGSYNPHTKELNLDKAEAEKYLSNGAQPSERVVKLFQSEKVKLPDWVKLPGGDKQKTIKNAQKLRKNQPEEPKEEVAEEATEAETPTEEAAPAPEVKSEAKEEASEAPAEEAKE